MDAVVLYRATEMHRQGNLGGAEKLYRSVLTATPLHPDALALLGVVLGERMAYREAVSFLRKAIQGDPAAPLFRYYLGTVLADAGDEVGATMAFRDALARHPEFAEAHYRLALILKKQQNVAEAVEHLRHATRIAPGYGAAWAALGSFALKAEDFGLAKCAAEKAVRLMPENLVARIALALALNFLDRHEEAIDALRQALRIKPDFIEAWDMLGLAYQQAGRLDEAEGVMRQAIEVAGAVIPDEESREVAEEEYSVQHWNLALLELLRGDFRRGFAHYSARFKKTGRAQRLAFPRPVWRGEDIRGKKILVVGEQGFGDVLMLCRYAPLLKAQGAYVVLLTQQAMASLLKQVELANEILCEGPQTQGDFDFQASIFDLPHRLGTRLDSIPSAIPYLPLPSADGGFVLPKTGCPRIGVVWAGRRDFGNDWRRSIPLSVFEKIFGESGAQFFNLTRELQVTDVDVLAGHGVVDLSSRLSDFSATARFVAQLDLVITCDTAMAHLAGGMGKKVWVLLSFAPDWRWLTEREDSPWYPSMRLFRQGRAGDWGGVVGRVRQALALFLGAHLTP